VTIRRGYVVRSGDGVDGTPGVKISEASSGGALAVIESDTDGGAPPHVHHREDEGIYVLDGSIVAHVGDEEFHAGARDLVFMPRDVLHDWDVTSGRARVLLIAAPGGLDAFLAAFHAAVDETERDAVAERHGLVLPR
jgi:mannose-6-phosphate isomerase-like protein (cupin superfamily)